AEVIKAVARSVLKPGFRRIFFLNGHGGNLIPASHALTELTDEDDEADAAHLALASWWDVAGEAMQAERHGMATPRLTHACEYETSAMLSLRPDLVDQDAIREGEPRGEHPSKQAARWAGVQTFQRFHRRTQSGHMGNPEEATAAKGESLLDAVVEQVVAFLEDFATWPPSQTLQHLEVSP
ncbi:MAG: creatininase family protein, partial [bacterium]